MNKQIASNRDLKVVAQKSQLSDKTEKMSLIIKRNRLSSAVVLNRELTLATSIRISTQNLRNRLHGAGLGLREKKRAVSRLLSMEHRNRRLQFAQYHVNCHIYPIQVVLWTAMNQDFDLISMMDFGVIGEKK